MDVVGIETPAYGGGPFSEVHFGLVMFSLEAAFEARKDCVLFDPATVKFLSTGSGDAAKADMIRVVQLDRMSTDLLQNDEADAYMVGMKAARFMQLRKGTINPDDLTEWEKKVFLTKSKVKGEKVLRTAHAFRENRRFFEFSRVPAGSVTLPIKSDIPANLINWLEEEGGNRSIERPAYER